MNEGKPERLLIVPWWVKAFTWTFAGPPAVLAFALTAAVRGVVVGVTVAVNMVDYLAGRE